MKNRLYMKKALALVMVLIFTVMAAAPGVYAIDSNLLMEGFRVTAQKEFTLVGGVSEKHYVLNDETNDNKMNVYTMEVNINDPDVFIVAGYNDGDTVGWGKKTVPEQAKAMEKNNGYNVIGATNGDFYNKTNGEPRGALIMNSVVGKAPSGYPYFAILKNGKAVIRDANVSTDDVKEAIGGILLARNGRLVTNDTTSREPRTAVGIKADGTVVMFVVDGRQRPDSCGMYYVEIAKTMLALGCVDVLNLDGGGSSTFMTEREGTNNLSVKNSPCYMAERSVSTSLMVCCSAQPTGVLDHVNFDSEIYECAPGSHVAFSATGVDANGFAVSLPSNGTYTLSDDSFGKIERNTFFANKQEGDVTISYDIDSVTYGSATINISKSNDTAFVASYKRLIQMMRNLAQFFQFVINKLFNM